MRTPTVKITREYTAGVVLLFVLCVLFSACSEEKMKPAISSTTIGHDIPTQESWNSTITFTDSGRVTGILRAGHIAMFSDKQYTRLDSSLTVDFYDRQQ